MWDHLPSDLLALVFSFLPPDSVARAMGTCKHWLASVRSRSLPPRHAPWLVAFPARGAGASCYVHDPAFDRWHALPLGLLTCPLRLVASVGCSLLCRLAASPDLRLALLNPFTRQFRLLPDLNTSRRNPAVGVVTPSDSSSFSVIVAGGASGSGFEPTVEVFDSGHGGWTRAGPMPSEFAVRLTVWTPDESVHSRDGAMYWMTSARAYGVVGFDLRRRAWREVKLPMAEQLEWAALVRRRGGRLGLVGGAGDGSGTTVWEKTGEDEWVAVGRVPAEIGMRFWGNGNAEGVVGGGTRCAGGEDGVYLIRDLGSEMLVWKDETKVWRLVEGRGCVPNIPVKAALLHPTLALSWLHAYL